MKRRTRLVKEAAARHEAELREVRVQLEEARAALDAVWCRAVELEEARAALGDGWCLEGWTLADGIRTKVAMLEGLHGAADRARERLAQMSSDEKAEAWRRIQAACQSVDPFDQLCDGVEALLGDLREGLAAEPEQIEMLTGLLEQVRGEGT